MPTTKPKLFLSLGSLPGGVGNYVVPSLVKLLTCLNGVPEQDRETFIDWIIDEFGVTRSTAEGYISTLLHLDVIGRRKSSRLTVTAFGQHFLTSEDRQRLRLIADYLLRRYSALREVLLVYSLASNAIDVDEAIKRYKSQFPQFPLRSGFYSRMRWLISLDCLVQFYDQHYAITDFGRELLVSVPDVKLDEASRLSEHSESVDSEKLLSFQERIKQTDGLDPKTVVHVLRAVAAMFEST